MLLSTLRCKALLSRQVRFCRDPGPARTFRGDWQFVIMPDHVHALVWFPELQQISSFMNKWKEMSAKTLKKVLPQRFPEYWSSINQCDAIWQPRYYGFNIWSRSKVEEKLDYMHMNPVRAGFVERVAEWRWSSARWYVENRTVGLPIRWPPD